MKIIENRDQFYQATHWNDTQIKYLEELVNSDDERDQIAAARMGYGLARLMYRDSDAVRQAVALAGYGLDELCKDKCVGVRVAVAENCKVVKLRKEVIDVLVNDPDITVKQTLIANRAGLDKLSKDENDFVRAAVAETGHAAHRLAYDESPIVRAGVAQALPAIQTENPPLAAALSRLFLHDSDWYVRFCLAETGFFKQDLMNDPVQAVRDAAEGSSDLVEHEAVNGQKVSADGWYPSQSLSPYDPKDKPLFDEELEHEAPEGGRSLTDIIRKAEVQAESQRDPDWCYNPCDHRSHGR